MGVLWTYSQDLFIIVVMRGLSYETNMLKGFFHYLLIVAAAICFFPADSYTQPVSGSESELIFLLNHPEADIREAAVITLGKRKSTAAVGSLAMLLKHDDVWGVRKSAAWALGEIADVRAVDPLINALQHSDWIIRLKSAEALGKTGDRRAVQPLIEILEDKRPQLHTMVAWALGEMCDARSVEPLIETAKSVIPDVRGSAARTLGKIKDSRALDILSSLVLHDRMPNVRKWAAWALGEINDTRALTPLASALGDSDYNVRVYAQRSLQHYGRNALDVIKTTALHGNKHAKVRAGWILDALNDQEQPVIMKIQDEKITEERL